MKSSFSLLFITFVLVTAMLQKAFAQWQPTQFPYPDAVHTLFAADGEMFVGTYGDGVYATLDNGSTWDSLGLGGQHVNALAVVNGTLYAGTDSGLYESGLNGGVWSPAGFADTAVYYMQSLGGALFAVADAEATVYVSRDNGTDWSVANTGLPYSVNNGAGIEDFEQGDNVLFLATDYGVYVSTDIGASWSNFGLDNEQVTRIVVTGTSVFAATGGGVFVATLPSLQWPSNPSDSGLDGTYGKVYPTCLAAVGNNVFAGSDGYGVYLTTDNGAYWVAHNQGLSGYTTQALAVSGGYVFAGMTASADIYRRPLSDFGLSAVQKIAPQAPGELTIAPNYPDPFAASTIIPFVLSTSAQTTLQVYNSMGEVVSTLLNGKLTAGEHYAVFNATALPAGMYTYCLHAGAAIRTGSMMAVK